MFGNIFCRDREKLILGYIMYFSCLSTSQIADRFFRFPHGLDKCRKVMKRILNKGEVKRFREREYIYYVGRKSPDWKSRFILNKLYFDIKDQGRIIKFQPELEFFSGRCDGFFVAEYKGERRKFFVEVDRATSNFNKCKIYNNLLQTDWKAEWWADPLRRGVISFPLIVVLTLRKHIVERDFMKADFLYHILDLYDPQWKNIFQTIV